MTYISAPPYGRKKADELIERVIDAAQDVVNDRGNGKEVTVVTLTLSADDLITLANMLYEMDRHLPDFFEEDV